MATLKELRDEIVLIAGVKGNPDFPPTMLNRRINHSQRYVQTELNGLGMKKWETAQVITAGLAAAAYNSASNNVKKCPINLTYFTNMLESPKSIIQIEVNDAGDPSYGIAREISPENFEEQLSNTYLAPTVGKPVFMRLSGSVWLAPVGITAATAHYFKAVADLSADATLTEIPIEFEDFIIKKTVLEIKNIKGEIQNMQIEQGKLDKEIQSSYEKFLGKMQEKQRVEAENNNKLQ
jgi:hypothetical protein